MNTLEPVMVEKIKIHVVIDGLGNPLYVQLTGGNSHNSTVTMEVLAQGSLE